MDTTIRCIQCDSDFVFSEREQQYYREHHFSAPKRCPACRKQKKKINDGIQNKKAKKSNYSNYYEEY